jgi:hypothetical protein
MTLIAVIPSLTKTICADRMTISCASNAATRAAALAVWAFHFSLPVAGIAFDPVGVA